jgi:hypothetical protein
MGIMSANTSVKGKALKLGIPLEDFWHTFRYGSEIPRFGIIYGVDTRGTLVVHPDHGEISGCREIIIGILRGAIGERKLKEGSKFNGIDKLRYFIGFNSENKDAAAGCSTIGVKIARAYDNILKCRPTTSQPITRLINENGNEEKTSELILHYIEADLPWAKSPVLVSLHMLLIRLGRFKSLAGLKSQPLNKIPALLPKIVDWKSSDGNRVKHDHKLWIEILKDYSKLFQKKKFSTTYDLGASDVTEDYMWEYGIDAFCRKL